MLQREAIGHNRFGERIKASRTSAAIPELKIGHPTFREARFRCK